MRKIRSDDEDLMLLQDNLASEIDGINAKVLVNGRRIKSVVIITGTAKIVNHGLGRPLLGWFPTRINADANVWEIDSPSMAQLTLNSSANVTVDLWVF